MFLGSGRIFFTFLENKQGETAWIPIRIKGRGGREFVTHVRKVVKLQSLQACGGSINTTCRFNS